MNDINEIRYSCAGTCFGFGASAVGIHDIAPTIACLLGFFAVLAAFVCALTFLVEAILEKKNEPAPVRTKQAQSARIFDNDLSITENFGFVNSLRGEKDDSEI